MKPKYPLINVHSHLVHASGEKRLEKAKEDGVVRFCCAAVGWLGCCSNEEIIPLFKKYPDFLVGLGYVNLGPEMDSPDKIDWLKENGFEGLKMIFPLASYNDDRYFPLYERAEKLEMPILFHTGWVSGFDPELVKKHDLDSTKYKPYCFDRIARYFPNLKIIGTHLGKPHFTEALQMVIGLPNVYYDFTGAGGSRQWVSTLKKELAPFPGADFDNPDDNPAHEYFKKFCFATDNPTAEKWYTASEDIMDYLHIPEETRRLFYWKNACTIFGWDKLAEELNQFQ